MRKLVFIIVAALAILGLAAPAANAGTCTLWMCGQVTNARASQSFIKAREWHSPYAYVLNPGQKSPLKDTDEVYIPCGYKGVGRSGNTWITFKGCRWTKINDSIQVTITTSRV